PDLLAVRALQVVEERLEARDEIALREQQVDWKAQPEMLVELRDSRLDRFCVRVPLGLALRNEVRDRKRDEDAVDRPPAPILLQEIQEAEPGGAVRARVAVLRRVAARRVDQHRFVGEPPVAMPRAADAADRARPELLAERKAQTGVHERGRLPGAGRADDYVPREVVEREAAVAAAGLLQHAQRFLEALADRRDFL